jgi:hypothetical protein
MKFGNACCELRIPSPGSNIERLPCYTGIDNEKAIGKVDKEEVQWFHEKIWQEFGKLQNCLAE